MDQKIIDLYDRFTHGGINRREFLDRLAEVAEEKEALAQYGSADSGASLGDILGAALKQRAGDKVEAEAGKTETEKAGE